MSTRLRGAVIGYGFIASRGHVPAFRQRDDVEIVAVADLCEARRERAAVELPGVRLYPDHRALLDSPEAAGLDFVDICTPPSDHAPIAHAALDRRLHVLCEKPLATTPEDARSLLQHAARAERVLFPCHNYKHAPVVRAIRALLDAGRIGAVHSITLDTYRRSHAEGVTEWRPHWRRDRRMSGGGIAMDHGSHTFYLAFDWMASFPTAVSARMACRDPGRHDTEDDFQCVLTFPSGVARAHLTWTAGVRKVVYTVLGERGAITVEDDRLELSTAAGPGAARRDVERRSIPSGWMDPSHVGWFGALFADFRGAIARREFVGREAREAALCVEVITAAYRSAREGSREVPLPAEPPGATDARSAPSRCRAPAP